MAKPRILLTTPAPDHVRAMLDEACEVVTIPGGGRPTRDQLAELLPTVDGLLTSNQVKVDNALLDACPNLKVVANNGVGYDNVDIPYATSKGVLVCNTPGVLNGAVADLTFLLLLGLARHVVANERHVRSGDWRSGAGRIGVDVRGKTLGIIGLGRIGHVVARTARGFDMKVIYYDPIRDPEAEASGLATYRERDDVLRESDFVSVHCFLDETTRHHIGMREYKLMKLTAYLINTSRGPVIDQDALAEALKAGEIAGAGLDVMETEPLDPSHALCSLDNVILLPHIASGTTETRLAMVELAGRNLIAAVTGGMPEAVVNPEVVARRRVPA
ncbi:MAG: D-glycerate dehydrogenase [Chloroflexi bacterium]|nr:D-glycerate dehydrogenase [Chloroflexota bacterium]